MFPLLVTHPVSETLLPRFAGKLMVPAFSPIPPRLVRSTAALGQNLIVFLVLLLFPFHSAFESDFGQLGP